MDLMKNLKIPSETHKALRMLAARKETTIAEEADAALLRYIKAEEKKLAKAN